LALQPETSFIPDPHTFVEHTGDMLSQFEEGYTAVRDGQTATTLPYEEDIVHSDLISDPPISEDKEVSSEEEDNATDESIESISTEVIPQVIDDGLDSNARRSTRTRNPPKLLTFSDFQADRKWQEMANNVLDMELFTACQAEVKDPSFNLQGVDPSPFMPPPMGVRSVLKMSDPEIKEGWLKAYQKEIKTLIDAKTFALDTQKEGETVIPTMETNKVKINSDGSLDKLKWKTLGHLLLLLDT
jgi:hypothetical protein